MKKEYKPAAYTAESSFQELLSEYIKSSHCKFESEKGESSPRKIFLQSVSRKSAQKTITARLPKPSQSKRRRKTAYLTMRISRLIFLSNRVDLLLRVEMKAGR